MPETPEGTPDPTQAPAALPQAALRPGYEGRSSLARRLVFGATIFIAVALVVAGFVINRSLHRFVTDQIDSRLDAELVALAAAIEVDEEGVVRLVRASGDAPPFDRPLSGWYWQVLGAPDAMRSRSLAGADIAVGNLDAAARPQTGSGIGPRGEALHLRHRLVTVSGAGGPLALVAAAPPAGVQAPLAEARRTLFFSLAVLGIALSGAVLLQVRLGLTPLRRLRLALAEVAAGRLERIPSDQPAELAPLVRELNGLIDRNEETLGRARAQAANLAHGLKTPLATLSVAVRDPARDPSGELQRLATQMERRITHHLRRARTAALSGPRHRRTAVKPHVDDLLDVLRRIHVERKVTAAAHVPADLLVACDPEDLDEMLGNLLDNAFKWSGGIVDVTGVPQGGMAILTITDDGQGLSPEEAAMVVQPGERLDETVPGDGFGLPITRELAALYGGSLRLEAAPAGGLSAILSLPMASGKSDDATFRLAMMRRSN